MQARVGTAGWSIPLSLGAEFPGDGQHLQRYARRLRCVEINSSFYRPHRQQTYGRWASLVPADFRFSVKLPRTITHDARLQQARDPLLRFLGEVAGLGDRLGVILVQLPPSLALEVAVARRFFGLLVERSPAAIVVEPRHASWFTLAADRMLLDARVARAAADPAGSPQAADPGGWRGLAYYRWHGSPRMYWSPYPTAWLEARKAALLQHLEAGVEPWCIFDNTAGGAALPNALEAARAYVAAG